MNNNNATIDPEVDILDSNAKSNEAGQEKLIAISFKASRSLAKFEKEAFEGQDCLYDALYRAWVGPVESTEGVKQLFDLYELDCKIKDIVVPGDYFLKDKSQRKKESRLEFLHKQELDLHSEILVMANKLNLSFEDLKEPLSEEGKYEAQINEEKRLRNRFYELTQIQSKIKQLMNSINGKEDVIQNFGETFLIERGQTHLAADKGAEILSDPNCMVFQQQGRTVRIVEFQTDSKKKKSELKRPNTALTIEPCDEIHLINVLNRKCAWSTHDGRSLVPQRTNFPTLAAKMILDRKGKGLAVLNGFVCCPTIREDGSLLETPGYDEESGLFFDPCGTIFTKIPENPTKDEAREALNLLKNLIKDFPFADDGISAAVALAEMMTGPIRRSLDQSPAFANDASTRGSGKTLLAKIPALLSTGKEPTMLAPTPNEAEMEKRLASAFMAGDPIICIDNIDFPFGSPDLCLALTAKSYNPRKLGKSKAPSVGTNSQLIFTGNNLEFRGDICTRILKCRLLPDCEHPEDRKFDRNLEIYIPKNRGELVTAILTIIRAYVIAGFPKLNELSEFRTYYSWNRFIRGPLVWLGEKDPYESAKEIKENDPEKEELTALFSSLYAAVKPLPIDSFTVSELLKILSKKQDNEEIKDIVDVIIEIAPDGRGFIDPKKLGAKIKKFKDRTISGYRITKAGEYGNAIRWKISKTT